MFQLLLSKFVGEIRVWCYTIQTKPVQFTAI